MRRRITEEPVSLSMGSVEVVSAESFQQCLEGMASSCMDCMKEREKEVGNDGKKPRRRSRRRARAKLNSPIVVHLRDTIRVSIKNKAKSALVEADSEDSVSESSASSAHELDLEQSASLVSGPTSSSSCSSNGRDGKNFNAFISAIENLHIKDQSGYTDNLDQFVQSSKDFKTNGGASSPMNNSFTGLESTHKTRSPSGRNLDLCKDSNIELICNDLHCESVSADISESSGESEPSENCSVVSSSESQTDSDYSAAASSSSLELCKDELERLREYTTGYSLARYRCLPHQCPHCLSTYYTYNKYYTDCATDYSFPDVFDKISSSISSDDDSEPDQSHVKVRGDGRVEVSVAKFFREKKSSESELDVDAVSVDLTNRNVNFSINYHDNSTEVGVDFYYHFYATMFGYIPYFVPLHLVPTFYTYPPMPKPLCVPRDLRCLSSQRFCLVPAHEVKNFTSSQPPQRPWIPVAHPDATRPTAIFTVMCYNVLCDKYATRQLYGYCPSWALNWEYRKKTIIEEIRQYSADIISLQEVETEQFYNFFMVELKMDGYDGLFSPKSRAKTMVEADRKHVDGCAIFYKTSKFSVVKKHLVEFNQLAISTAEGHHDMINRVMTKDNIGLAALLQTKEGAWENGLPAEDQIKQPVLVATCHVHWDPEFCDVKLIQTMMLLHELKNIVEESQRSFRPGSGKPDCNAIPLILCGDLNSLPDSGVVQYLSSGRVPANHEDFKDLGYQDCLQKLSVSDSKDQYVHSFKLSQAYGKDVMPYTNYTYDFKGIIDYIFFSRDFMRHLGFLGNLDPEWFRENKVMGCPHPHIPSDHLPLLLELEMAAPASPSNSGSSTTNNSSNNSSSNRTGTTAHNAARR